MRLIVDICHPHEEGAVNASIDDEMEVEMTFIKRWTVVEHWLGCSADACKNDWNAAYKHEGVSEGDNFL